MPSDLKAPKFDQSKCPRCGIDNHCGMALTHGSSANVSCWCLNVDAVLAHDENKIDADARCYCADCLKLMKATEDPQ